MSWSTSVKESNGLMDYINKELTEYRIENEWQTIKHAQFEISYMIWPILETMRNILRNIILWKNTLNQFIKLNAKPLHSRATRCLSCKGDLEQVAEFWIFSTRTHAIEKNGCLMCMCSLDQHVTIDYALSYTRLNNTFHDVQNAMVERLTALSHASVEFAHFLIHTAYSTKDDPFLNGLVEMIAEETYTCEIKISNNFNKQLCEELSKLANEYEQRMNKKKSIQENIDLPAVYKLIKIISECSVVREQIIAVKKRHRMMIEEYEYEVQKM
ncbi:unnamed protein product [Rotaria sp. Silwood2]|nr:unnamed protein product [Rotaria sp. Silwood2]